MKEYVSERAKKLAPYDPSENKYKIKLDANESYIKIPQRILDFNQCLNAVELNRYPDPLCKSLCSTFGKFINVSDDKIVAGNGSDEIISLLFPSFLNPGDNVLTFSPDFSMYSFYCEISGMNNIVFNSDDKFNIDVKKVIDISLKENIKMIIFSNPCNPSGNIISHKDIEKILSSVKALVVVDEAYMDFADESVLDLIDSYPNLLVLKTCSKAVAMAGIRLGFAIGNEKLISVIRKVKSPFNVNSVTAAIGERVLKEKEFILNSIKEIKEHTLYLKEKLNGFKSENFIVYDTFTNFVFVKTEYAEKIYKYLLDNDICVRFMMNNYLRITAGTIEEIDIFINCLNKFFKEKCL